MTVEIIDGLEVDFADLEAKYKVEPEESLDTVLIIDHLPKIDQSKEEKLLAVLKKNIFAVAKATPIPTSICMPRNESDGMSKGYLFVEFETVGQADAVLQVADGYRLDKSHVLTAVRLSDFERLRNLNDEYQEPHMEPFEEKEYLRSWLTDPMARDQFVTLAGNTASIFWNARAGQQPELVHTRANWTDSYVKWSPRGSYLVSVHGPGVMLWGGASFSRLGKFPHPNVKLVAFSNTETFMCTWSPMDPTRPTDANMMVWDVVTCKLVRAFVAPGDQNATNMAAQPWPLLKFSHDDKYAARIHDSTLHIYELPTFALLDKKTEKIEGIKDFSWSPVDHTMVHWTMGTEDIPSRVSLMAVPSRTVTRTKNLFNVNTCQVHWQSGGDYLCVQVERHTKNKKQVFSNLELFRLKEKGIPVDSLEFKDPILTSFAWEPEGHRFLAAGTTEFKTTIFFYTMKAQDNGLPVVKLCSTQERKSLTRFLWSPRGEFVLFMGTDSTSSTLEFFNAGDMTTLANREHFLASDAAWDPSGRFVASWVSAWKHTSDHGFILWDIRGEQVARLNTPRLAFFSWRPHPPSLLDKEAQREIRKNMKQYSSAFEEADLKELSLESSNTAQMKSRLVMVWNEWRRHCKREYETRNAVRKSILGVEHEYGHEMQQCTSLVEEWIEEVLEETEEPIE